MDRASSFAEFTNKRNFEEDSLGSDVESGTETDTTDTNDTVNSSRSAATGNPTAVRISPKTTGSRAIDVDFTAKQSNCLSLVSASTATQKMLWSGSLGPQSEMADYYKSRAEIDRIRQPHEFELNEEKLWLEQARFDIEEWKEQVERKRLKADENKSLSEAYAEISS
jgi:hypothetical protein